MGRLAEYLKQPTAVEPAPETRTSVFDGDGNHTNAAVLDRQPANTHELLEIFGHDADAFGVDGSVSVSHRELVDGRTVSTYRYRLIEKAPPLDIEPLVKAAMKAKPHKVAGGGDHYFVFHSPDWQAGKKSELGGTEEIIEKYIESLNLAVAEYKALQYKGINGVLLAFAGDLCEGIWSQGGKNIPLTELTLMEQARLVRRLMMVAVEKFAPLTDDLILAACNGNHDTSQRAMNTNPGDGLATEAAVAVSDALQMNPAAYSHVRVIVPNEWRAHMTFEVGDSVVAMTHGDLFRPLKGMDWWAGQTFGKQGPGSADVLLSGHYHNFLTMTDSGRTWIQGSTLDMGSDWFRDAKGCTSDRGAVICLLRGGKVSNMSLV